MNAEEQKNLKELMNKNQEAIQEEIELQKKIKILEENLKKHMTPDAYLRYNNLKLAHQRLAVDVLVLMNKAIEGGSIDKIDDVAFKDLLQRFKKSKKDFRIIRK